MPTVLTHAVAAVALITAFPERAVPRRWAVIGAVCAMAPDFDVIGFHFGVRYDDLCGHRGLFHSLAFAAVLAALAMLLSSKITPPLPRHPLVWVYLFLATASHGLLDALTDGGLGVALLSPFDTTRYFFPIPRSRFLPSGRDFSRHGGYNRASQRNAMGVAACLGVCPRGDFCPAIAFPAAIFPSASLDCLI